MMIMITILMTGNATSFLFVPRAARAAQVTSLDKQERPLDLTERVLDLVAYWSRLNSEERAKKGKGAEVSAPHSTFFFFSFASREAICQQERQRSSRLKKG